MALWEQAPQEEFMQDGRHWIPRSFFCFGGTKSGGGGERRTAKIPTE
jgi:hypothetical protein